MLQAVFEIKPKDLALAPRQKFSWIDSSLSFPGGLVSMKIPAVFQGSCVLGNVSDVAGISAHRIAIVWNPR